MKKIPNGVITISSVESFNSIVNSFRKNLILVDFYTDWCQPCKSFKPVYEKVQRMYHDRGVIFARLNTEHFPDVARQFNIQGVPSLMFIKNKKGLKKHVGALNRSQLQQLISYYL